MSGKLQLFLIHGGMTFKSKRDYLHFLQTREVSVEPKVRWSDEYLTSALGADCDIIRPRMPLQDNAKYREWELHFERFIPHLHDDLILVGSSLGGIFLAKYLSEHTFPKRILSVYLIAPPYDNSVEGEDLVGGFRLKHDLSQLEHNTKNLYLMFSKDDPVVPLSHAEKYHAKLPLAKLVVYESKGGHFQVPEFPEIVEMIRTDAKERAHPVQ